MGGHDKSVAQNLRPKDLQTLYEKGELYQATYRGFYSVRQEQFLTDKERGPDGSFGPEWGEVVELEEENWYFRLAKYRDWLLAFLEAHPTCVSPAFRQQELRNAAEKLTGDLSISRPKSRLAWGIELPFDSSCVTYVWFDALVNYISFAGYLEDDVAFRERWPALHVIGKDILIPAHGIYWLAMLKAMGFADEEMPTFLVHGYVLVDGDKMSKSLGNIRDPNTFIENFGVEALRYYLMRDCVVGQDMDFTDERLVQRFNSELANGLGNLVNRTLTMAHRYRHGRLSPSIQDGLRDRALSAAKAYAEAMEGRSISLALEKVTVPSHRGKSVRGKNCALEAGSGGEQRSGARRGILPARGSHQVDRDHDLAGNSEGFGRYSSATELDWPSGVG